MDGEIRTPWLVDIVDIIEQGTINQLTVKDKEFVLVVRCKDCQHYWKNNPNDDVSVCLASPKDDAFCSEGERREDEQK